MKKILLAALALMLSACSPLRPQSAPVPTAVTIPERRQWEDADIARYRFKLDLSCFCGYGSQMPLTVEVRDGQVVSMADSSGQFVFESNPGYDFFVSYGTMENIFDKIETALNDPKAGDIIVKYDPALGYPIEASIDYIELAADDEMYLSISEFEALS